MGITTLGIPDHARATAARSASAPSTHRRSKLVGAFALTATIGLGSYIATYRALTVVSTPTTSHTVAPATPTTAHP
jgi:hypothetical protein